MGWINLCGAACIAGLLPSGAIADLIFDQSIKLGPGASFSDLEFPQQVADDFKLISGASTITDIHWWGAFIAFSCCADPPTEPDNFTIRIFGDIGGLPAINPVFEFFVGDVRRVDTGLHPSDLFASDLFAYSVDISPLPLLANTTYWLSILNDTAKDNIIWAWSAEIFQTGNYAFRHLDGEPWFAAGPTQLAFQLTNDAVAVPEPATWAMLAAGLAGLSWMSRRRKTKG